MAELRLYTVGLSKIEVKPDKMIGLGKTEQLTVAGILNNGRKVDLLTTTGAAVSYSSSDPNTLSVDETGKITGNKEGSADITVNATLNGVSISKTINLTVDIISDNSITTVESLSDIKVATGTNKEDLELPENVFITLGNLTTTSAAVTWDSGNPVYNGNSAGTYSFTGTLDIPKYITNPNNLQASVNVIVGDNNEEPKPDNPETEEIPVSVKIQGTERVGKTLKGEFLKENGTEFTTSASVTYEWYRLSSKDDNEAALVGEGKTYKLVSDDKGKYIKLVGIYGDYTFEDITGKIAKKSKSSSSSSSPSNNSSSSENNNSQENTSSTNNQTGPIVNGWENTTNNKRYINNGQPVTGWNQIDGAWYLMDQTGNVQIGWKEIDGEWYLLKNDGIMATGWQEVNNTWYFLKDSGAMAKGWIYLNGIWYFLKENGAMAVGWQQSNGEWYYLFNSGAMASNTVIDGYTVDESGAWVK
jgi:glucan-binding YG repeat protein